MAKRIMVFILVLALAAMLPSCRREGETIGEKPRIGELEAVEEPDHLTIHVISGRVIEEEYIKRAADEFKRLFGMDLRIDLDLAIDINGVKTAGKLNSTGADGLYLFSLANVERVNELAELGTILPFDELLKDNPVWNTMPENIKSMYRFDDGKVWAIPRSFTQVPYGRIFRTDYLESLDMGIPEDLDSLYEVSLALSQYVSEDGKVSGLIGMTYSDATSFRDIFYANGVPVNKSNDGINNTSISFNPEYGSFEDSMLIKDMEVTLEYILKMRNDGILRQMRGRSYRRDVSVDILENEKIANVYQAIPEEVFTDERFVTSPGITGLRTSSLNPVTNSLTDGFYVLGANTERASATANYFLSRFYGDLETYLFASRGIPGELYEINGGTKGIEVLDFDFFTFGPASLIGENPICGYDDMDISFDRMMTAGEEFLEGLKKAVAAKEEYVRSGLASGIMYELPVTKAYPEVFKADERELISSSAGTLFDNQFNRILSGRVSVADAVETYKRDMKTTGMQDIINELNRRIGVKTMFSY